VRALREAGVAAEELEFHPHNDTLKGVKIGFGPELRF
jgi:hypothetical protein